MTSPDIQWYPGHIAKAEKALMEQLSRVDVVLEVRDARIPLTTCHPRLNDWVGSRGRVLVLNRVDMISTAAQAAWDDWLRSQGQTPFFTNAQQGQGISSFEGRWSRMIQNRQHRSESPPDVRILLGLVRSDVMGPSPVGRGPTGGEVGGPVKATE